MPQEELEEILDVWGMTEPGISGKELLLGKGKREDSPHPQDQGR